jgi:hypothetical protein
LPVASSTTGPDFTSIVEKKRERISGRDGMAKDLLPSAAEEAMRKAGHHHIPGHEIDYLYRYR